MATLQEKTAIHTLISALAQALSAAFSQRFSEPWTCEMDAAAAPGVDAPFGFTLNASGSVTGTLNLQFSTADVTAIETKLATAKEAGIAAGEQLEVLLNQMAESAARIVVPSLGQIQFTVARSQESGALNETVILALTDGSGTKIPIEVVCDAQLTDSLSKVVSDAAASGSAKGGSNANVGLIMGVELDVTLRFGQRTLTLGEILNLNAGSVVELDRQVQEPVELLLKDRVIARGEVVVIDGNYGLRITDVVDAQARMGAI